ncbi:MAG: phage head morphogenesis protein, partial [Lachnospiraceae bacterium]|nr:phage head morphogenesis protein [Lachnospiraceae bacterium]
FMEKHDLGRGEQVYFDSSYDMAQSWQRLIDGRNIQEHDITLIKHEIMESEYVKNGMSQDEAHKLTSKKYNYAKEADEYNDKIRAHKKK